MQDRWDNVVQKLAALHQNVNYMGYDCTQTEALQLIEVVYRELTTLFESYQRGEECLVVVDWDDMRCKPGRAVVASLPGVT